MAVGSKKINKDSTATFILKINEILLSEFGKPDRNLTSDPLDILIATVLSQNTNDLNSFKAFQNLKKHFKNYEELLSADIKKIEKVIRIAGLGKQKSRSIKNILLTLKKERGELDLSFLKNFSDEEGLNYLLKFNGVGLKTAACVLLFGLKRNICPVDTHVHRTLNRIGIVNAKERDKTFFELNKILPPDIAHEFHTNLIKLGRTYCLSQNPDCNSCPVLKLCNYGKKNNKKKNSRIIKMTAKKDFMLLDSV